MGCFCVAAILAAYSRRDLTLACSRSLRAQNLPDLIVDASVLDDASVHGTDEAIARLFPDLRVLQGDGTFCWNGGMPVAFAAAMQGDYDYYLGLNDYVHRYVLVRHPVRPPLRWTPYRTVGGSGATLFMAHVLDYVGNNLCTFVVGRSAGAAVVGQVNRAYYLAFPWARIYLGEVLANVLFSSLSAIQGGDKTRVGRVHLCGLYLGAVAPCAGMAVAAPALVRVVLGPLSQPAAGILPCFALAAVMSILSRFSYALAESRAEVGRPLLAQDVYLVTLSLLLLVAYDFKAKGVWLFAAAVAVGELCRFAAYLLLTRRPLGLLTVEVVRSLLPGIFAAAVLALAVGLLRMTRSSEVAFPIALLAAEFLVANFAYAVGVRAWLLPDARRELWSSGSTFGALGRVGRWWRLALSVLGPRASTTGGEPP